jgi:hypothetical protein
VTGRECRESNHPSSLPAHAHVVVGTTTSKSASHRRRCTPPLATLFPSVSLPPSSSRISPQHPLTTFLLVCNRVLATRSSHQLPTSPPMSNPAPIDTFQPPPISSRRSPSPHRLPPISLHATTDSAAESQTDPKTVSPGQGYDHHPIEIDVGSAKRIGMAYGMRAYRTIKKGQLPLLLLFFRFVPFLPAFPVVRLECLIKP